MQPAASGAAQGFIVPVRANADRLAAGCIAESYSRL